MHRFARLLCGASIALFAASAASAGTLIPVAPFSGSAATNVFDINDGMEITGDYTDSGGIEHGFFGFLGSGYINFDYGGTAIGTEPRSINNDGFILGFAPDSGFANGPEFLRDPEGTISTFKKTGAPLDGIAQGLTRHQISVGDYVDPATAMRTGYKGKNGKYKSDIVLGVPATRVSGRDINAAGAITGFFLDDAGDHGFILDGSGTHVYDIDDSGTTTFEGLSDKGIVTGQVVDADLNNHAFIFDPATSTVTWIDVPGSINQQAWGINKRGYVAVSTDIGSYIYCPLKPRRCPSGGFEITERTTRIAEGLRRGSGTIVPRTSRHGAAR